MADLRRCPQSSITWPEGDREVLRSRRGFLVLCSLKMAMAMKPAERLDFYLTASESKHRREVFSQALVVIDLHCVDRSRNAQWDNDPHRGPRMGACTGATLAPHAATAAHRQPLTEPRRRHRPSPAVTGRRPLSHAASHATLHARRGQAGRQHPRRRARQHQRSEHQRSAAPVISLVSIHPDL